MKGILGTKIGMTQVFSKSGKLTPVTAVLVEPNVITQIKTKENDGYEAIQLAYGSKKEKNTNKPTMGHLKKANTTPKRFLKEIRGVELANYSLGQEIKADIFSIGEMVDVTGTSKGKGFQGAIKRHNQSRGPMAHGSRYHRRVGSMGPMRNMRVPKGKKLPGQMGGVTVTIQNVEIVDVDLANNIILIKGNVPGPKKSLVMIRTAVKNSSVIKEREELITYVEEVTPVVEETVEAKEEQVEVTEEVAETETEEIKEDSEETTEEVQEVAVEDSEAALENKEEEAPAE